MLKVLIHKNIYFISMLGFNILYLLFATQQELIFLSYFVIVSQLTRQCAEGLIQPRVLNNINSNRDKTTIYASEILTTLGFACLTASILAYSLEFNILTILSTIPIIIIVILLQPALSELNKDANFQKWNKILIIPEVLSFLIFMLAHHYELKFAIHVKYLSQSGLLLILKFLLKLPFPIMEWKSSEKMKHIRISVITNLLSKNIDKYIVGIVLLAPDFMLYERVVFFFKALTSVFFQPLNIWVQNRSRKLKHEHIRSYLNSFMTVSLLISFVISFILIILSKQISINGNEVSEKLLRYFIIILPIFVLAAQVSCTSGFLYALDKAQIVRDMTLTHFSYSIGLYALAAFWINDVYNALLVLFASNFVNYLMVVFFLLKAKIVNSVFALKQTASTIISVGILMWIN